MEKQILQCEKFYPPFTPRKDQDVRCLPTRYLPYILWLSFQEWKIDASQFPSQPFPASPAFPTRETAKAARRFLKFQSTASDPRNIR